MKIFLLALLMLVNLNAKSLFSNDSQKESSMYIGALKNLVISTQKTRGLTNSYLSGNSMALLLVHETQKDMKDAIGDMEASTLAADPVINSRATSISQELTKLNRKAVKMDRVKAFEAYTGQIEQILMLAQTVSRRNSKDLNPLGQDASKLMMEVILPMTEFVGRMRGMGSGIAAKNRITKDQTLKIMTLSAELESLDKHLNKGMQTILDKHKDGYNANITTTMNSIQNATKKYIALTRNTLVKDPSAVDPTDYFDEGTDIITLLVKLFDTNNRAIIEDSKGWI